jgi:hypothetical protein
LLLWTAPGIEFYLNSSDHGYQLSLGHQITLGKFPFVDFFYHYGPLAAYTSAIGIWLSDSLLGETIICALGYALALALIYRITVQHCSSLIAAVATLMGYILMARFYKWYYWLFPLAALYCFMRVIYTENCLRRKWFIYAGIIDGLAALYRMDLGIACTCFHIIVFIGESTISGNKNRLIPNMAAFLFFDALPFLVWMAELGLKGGSPSIRDYFAATLTGATGAVVGMSSPFPRIDFNSPLSRDSMSALAFVLVPTSYCIAIGAGIYGILRSDQTEIKKWELLVATGVMGFAVFPQALHRSDTFHLVQVVPPAILGTWCSVCALWEIAHSRLARKAPPRLAAAILAVLLVVCVWSLNSIGRSDMVSLRSAPLERFLALSQITQHKPHDPIAYLTTRITNESRVVDSLLVATNAPQFYFFSNRPMAGLFNCYVSGLFVEEEWRRRDLDRIRKNKPALIVVSSGFPDIGQHDPIMASRPELYNFLREHYMRVVAASDYFTILARKVDQ